MKTLKLVIVAIALFGLAATLSQKNPVHSQSRENSGVDRVRREKFRHNGNIQNEAPDKASENDQSIILAEAPAAFDNLTNGFSPQGPDFDTIEEDNVNPLASFNDNRFIFEEFEGIDDGLGPTYNAQSCRECHQNVVTGSGSQITEQRTGRTVNGEFFESPGGSLIHSRATDARIVELVADNDRTRTFRMSLSTLGDGFIEAISNQTILAIRANQPASMRGNAVVVAVFEGNGDGRVGRFGWKGQHASLFSFSADAYLNEMGITTPTLPEENTSSGVFVGFGSGFDPVPEPEDDGIDVQAFADFMRATKAPPRGTISSAAASGEIVFNQLSCNVCHVASITTAPAGTVINAGAMTVPPALGNKTIHPYSDFLLHDIGTGDGIPILPLASFSDTDNQIRTVPLWGLRTRSRLMHDGLTFTLTEAIQRHRGQATASSNAFANLSQTNKNRLIAFLKSL